MSDPHPPTHHQSFSVGQRARHRFDGDTGTIVEVHPDRVNADVVVRWDGETRNPWHHNSDELMPIEDAS